MSIHVRNVSKRFGDFAALDGVSLEVEGGSLTALLGPSGSGKSTLLHCAAGILTPDAGAVHVDGQDLAALPEEQRAALRRTKVGIVLQFGQLVPDLPLVDNVALPLLLGGHERGEAHKTAMNWLDQVGIADDADAVPGELSGGQTQRAAVARALVTGPSVVLADEPTGSLDSRAGQELLDVLLEAARYRGAALLMVTHDNLVAASANREIRLRDGLIQHEVSL
jgi:putative ABC transport system ATP-binding protein